MQTADATGRAEQEAFIRAFLRENVRATDDVALDDTSSEEVSFDLVVAWKLAIDVSETEHVGAYKGDAATIFVGAPESLVRETEAYAAGVLRDGATFTSGAAALTKLDDRGLHREGKVEIRREPAAFAAVVECSTCRGSGKTSCRTCSGSGRVNCTTCSATGSTTHGTCGGTGRIASSSSSGGTTYQTCTCQGGKVTCSRCSGARRLTCRTCSGNGKTTCDSCKGTGRRSTVRTLTLVASPARTYRFAAGTSSFACDVLSRSDPAALPESVYAGSWEPEARVDEGARSVSFTKHASTRFLATRVHVGEAAFDFRTYGRTLRVADGGGIVEHVLRYDKDVLSTVVARRPSTLATDPLESFARLTAACRIALASKVHELAFARHFGATAGEEVLGSLSDSYAEETVTSLLIAFARLTRMLSVVPWVVAFAAACFALVLRHDRIADLARSGAVAIAISRVPFVAAFVIGAIVALVYLATRILPIATFADPSGEPSLRCLTLARGQSFVKTTLCAAGLALLLSALVITP